MLRFGSAPRNAANRSRLKPGKIVLEECKIGLRAKSKHSAERAFVKTLYTLGAGQVYPALYALVDFRHDCGSWRGTVRHGPVAGNSFVSATAMPPTYTSRMKQILQSLRSGEIEVAEVPAPAVRPGHLLIRTSRSLVSVGTERMLVEFGKAGWIDKARQQPDKVAQVLDKIRTDGLMPTLDSVRNKLDQPIALGYCNVGRVIEAGRGVTGFSVGDRVVSNGKHAEIVCVPANLCAAVPAGVDDDAAAFTVLGAIALQGIRLTQPTLGECVVVTGLGLIGLIAVQILRANGCRVLGLDFDKSKLDIARRMGADVVDLSGGADAVNEALAFSRGRGVDAVLITASTRSDEPVHQAALMSRKRGRIVLVGVTGLALSRADFYEKELSFQVSCSYGPGRYDPEYEDHGHDYPLGFVRWTEQRNFEAVLDLLSSRALETASLITHRFELRSAGQAYQMIAGPSNALGIVLDYSAQGAVDGTGDNQPARAVRLPGSAPAVESNFSRNGTGRSIGVIGSGNYASAVLIPAFKAAGASLNTVVSYNGVSSVHVGRKYGFSEATTDAGSVLDNTGIGSVVITTRHDSHARYVCSALAAGKNVFVEKPLALNLDELTRIQAAYATIRAAGVAPIVMVGFNRRFAPHVIELSRQLAAISAPRAMVMTVNAGAIPASHWTQDPAIGGGRIVGECCHFIDLMRHLAGSPIRSWSAHRLGVPGGGPAGSGLDDKASIGLQFENGSMATIHYLANGHKSFPKERLEVFVDGRVAQIDNFRRLTGYGWSGLKRQRLWRQDKGQAQCVARFLQAIETGIPPIDFEELVEVSRVTIEIAAALRAVA